MERVSMSQAIVDMWCTSGGQVFNEDYPELHVIAAGSLLEFTLEESSSFGVDRMRPFYMYPFSFDEYLMAQNMDLTIDYKKKRALNATILSFHHH